MSGFSFIHAADLHLDAPFRGLGLLPENEGFAPQKTLKKATFLALERLTEVCITSGADFLLLAGDVYNSADSSLAARLALRDAFVRLDREGIGVFLAHGNHDPLQAEQGAVPWPGNVHVFGAENACRVAFARGGGAPVALVHGVSHTGPAESRNLAAAFKRKSPSLLEPDLFQIGLLHCALAGVSGGHDAYAPCAFADLAEAELDYWALGHVHACRLFDRRGKALSSPWGQPADQPDAQVTQVTAQPPAQGTAKLFAAYSGSLQGLHVNEAGPHGCLHVRVDAKGRAFALGMPLAPVRWETLRLEPGPDLAELPGLETMLLDRLEALPPTAPGNLAGPDVPVSAAPTSGAPISEPPGFAPDSVAVRVILDGQSPLHAELADPAAAEELRRRLSRELAASRVWIRDLAVSLAPVLDMDAARLRPDLAGEVLRLAGDLEGDAMAQTASNALDPLFKRPRLRKDLAAPEEEELTGLVNEAALLCLDLLGSDTGGDD